MKRFFTYDENVNRQMTMIQIRIRQMKNGEIASQLQGAGLDYEKLYGVSLVQLRQVSQDFKPCNNLAERLWYKNVRETMILATMIAEKEKLSDEKLTEWADLISNIELAEQMAFNLIGKRSGSYSLLEKWILHPKLYVRYTALMAIGWQFRFVGLDMSKLVKDHFGTLDALGLDSRLTKAVTHCFKLAGRFDKALQPSIRKLAQEWTNKEEKHLKIAGGEVLFEFEI